MDWDEEFQGEYEMGKLSLFGGPAGELVLSLVKSVHFTVQALEALTQQEAGTPRVSDLQEPFQDRQGGGGPYDLRTQGEPRSSSWLLLLSYWLCAQTSLRTKCPVRMRLLHPGGLLVTLRTDRNRHCS